MDTQGKLQQLIAYFPPEMHTLYFWALALLVLAGLMGMLYLRSQHALRDGESGMKTFRYAMTVSTIVAIVVCAVATVMHHRGAFIQYAAVQ